MSFFLAVKHGIYPKNLKLCICFLFSKMHAQTLSSSNKQIYFNDSLSSLANMLAGGGVYSVTIAL